jgi:glycosyltransferase involved in cell wall biosynthesis
MNGLPDPTVAVLLPTYNGARYVDAQISSLKENVTPFTLHWLDDHSSDETRSVVRDSVRRAGIETREWHQAQHLGFPTSFLQLIEKAEADIYLFCDQDDLWQPGKIDAIVAHLVPDLAQPAMCFSLALWFWDEAPEIRHQASPSQQARVRSWLRDSRVFTLCPSQGNTIGFTGPLRDLYMDHRDIARRYAIDHDWWFYILATASGTVRMLSDVPTTIYRRHADNVINTYIVTGREQRLRREWRREQIMRRRLAQQAQGFLLVLPFLTPSPRRDRLLTLAKLVAQIDRKQSWLELLRLARLGAMSRWWGRTWLRTAICLCCDAS